MKIGYKIDDLIEKYGASWVADMLFRDLTIENFENLLSAMRAIGKEKVAKS